MAIVREVKDLGWFLSHRDYLEEIYKSAKVEPVDVFDIQTPFRMDAEAARFARELETCSNPDENFQQRKRRRKKVKSTANDEDTKLFESFLCSSSC